MKKLKIAISLFLSILSISCQYNLLMPPTLEPARDRLSNEYGDVISIPQDVKVSHGKQKSVEISWTPIPNAIQYQIFSASTPYESFSQTAETKKAENSITITENSGISKYYTVKAVNYFGTISEPSTMVYGSTLATPIITGIENSDSGTESTVTWWMENCNENTYLDKVKYIIGCFKSDRTTLVGLRTAEKSQTSVSFDNLEPNTNYFYQVEAFLESDQDSVEKSDMLDAETAHRLVPKAPEEISASQGNSPSEILISWKLPDYVDYKVSAQSFSKHPLYFTIERKLKNQPDSAYIKLVNYIGTVRSGTTSEINFSSKPEGVSSSNPKLTLTAGSGSAVADYENYVPGAVLTYKDTESLKRGLQYSYRIRSYVDDTTRTISSDKSFGATDGWLISIPYLMATGQNNHNNPDDDTSSIESVNTSFNVTFETFGANNYTYFITETRTSLDNSTTDPETTLHSTSSLNSLNGYTKTFNYPESQKGYYKYRLYITPAGSTDYSSPIIAPVESLGDIIVTNDPNDIPKIENLNILDGYSDHYELSWDYNQNCGYQIEWKTYINGEAQTPETIDVDVNDAEKCTISGGKITYKHSAASGDEREYNVIAVSGTKKTAPGTGRYMTLGTADISIPSYEYDSIKIKWPEVNKADADYIVKAHYEGDATELATSSNTTITPETQADGTKLINCSINAPAGYNDATKSGKPIQLTVTSKNTGTGNTTTATKTVRTLGPAMTNTRANTDFTNNNVIAIEWDKTEGATGYNIYRLKYSYDDFNTVERTDMYYYDAKNNILSVKSDDLDSSRATITPTGNKFILKDICKEDDSNSTKAYRVNQAEICFGIPYGYVVLPVKQNGDYEFEDKKLILSGSSNAKLDFLAAQEIKTASYGYGINLQASKAVSGDTQELSWTKPYNAGTHVGTIYRRLADSDGNWEIVDSPLTTQSTISVNVPLEDRAKAFEYLVRYQSGVPVLMPEKSIVSKFDTTKDDSSLYSAEDIPEKRNKGYLLAVDFSAKNSALSGTDYSHINFYDEQLNWSNWDYSKRTIGPTSAKIEIYNKNIDNTWHEVASLDNKCELNGVQSLTDIQMDQSTIRLTLRPQAIAAAHNGMGTTNGLLKVLRDSRHYYRLVLKRGESITATMGGTTDDSGVYAYRNITKEELVKSALLQFAYAFYIKEGGKPDYSNINERLHYGANSDLTSDMCSGSAKFEGKQLISFGGKYKATFSMTNYSQAMKCPDDSSIAFLKLTVPDSSVQIQGLSDDYIQFFRTDGGINVTVQPLDSKTPSSYSGKINFICTGSGNLTVKLDNNQIYKTNGDKDWDGRKQWLPMQIDDQQFHLTNKNFGWWPQ